MISWSSRGCQGICRKVLRRFMTFQGVLRSIKRLSMQFQVLKAFQGISGGFRGFQGSLRRFPDALVSGCFQVSHGCFRRVSWRFKLFHGGFKAFQGVSQKSLMELSREFQFFFRVLDGIIVRGFKDFRIFPKVSR